MFFARYDITGGIGLLILISVTIILFLQRKKYNSILKILITARSQHLLIHYSPTKRLLKYILFFLGFLFLAIALLQPQINKKPITVKEEGWSITVALDISRSMQTKDVGNSRLFLAKEKIKHLLEILDCARLSLILFSSDAFVQCPLTGDKEAFLLFLDQVDTEHASVGSTALDRALSVALDSIRTTENKNNIILLVSDGEDFSHNLSHTKQKARDQNVIVCAMGVGSMEGGPVAIFDVEENIIGYEKDEQGKVIISRLNEDTLYALTQDLQGFYIRATENNDDDIKKIVRFIQLQRKNTFDNKEVMLKYDLYPFFLLGGFVCLAAEWML